MIAVFDLGGGTFDISIMSVENGIFEVLATGGDSALGGEDWDRRILERIVDEVFDQHRVDLTRRADGAVAPARGVRDTRRRRCRSIARPMIQLPFLANDQHGAPINYERTVTRDEIEAADAGPARSRRGAVRARARRRRPRRRPTSRKSCSSAA